MSKDLRTPPIDPAEVEAMPKVSLHDHLDGGLRLETILDLAAQDGVRLPASEPEKLRRWLRPSEPSLTAYLRAFKVLLGVLQTPNALYRAACEHVESLAAENVVHAEIRWAPAAHLNGGLTREAALEAVTAGVRDGIASAARHGHQLSVGQILCILRGIEDGHDTARLALEHRDQGVVAVDLAGDEARHGVLPHREAFAMLAAELMPVTIHAGEAAGVQSITEALVDGRALRIGHGVRIIEDITSTGAGHKLGRVAAWIRDRGIPLEVSPTSNLETGAVPGARSMSDHPIGQLRDLGLSVTVNTDNRLLSATTMTREITEVSRAFGYGRGDLIELQRNAANAAFLPTPDRFALLARIS